MNDGFDEIIEQANINYEMEEGVAEGLGETIDA